MLLLVLSRPSLRDCFVFTGEKDSFGSEMVVTKTMSLDSVEPLQLEGGEQFTAGGATVEVTARLKGGFCGSSCCC